MITIGQQLEPKRGRKVPACTVRMIHRPDRCVTVIYPDGRRGTIKFSAIRKDYRS